jgi:hypothetical protein
MRDMNQVPYWAPTIISRHCRKFSRQGDLITWICATLKYGHIWRDVIRCLQAIACGKAVQSIQNPNTKRRCSVKNRMHISCKVGAIHCAADVVRCCHRQRCDQPDLCPFINKRKGDVCRPNWTFPL